MGFLDLTVYRSILLCILMTDLSRSEALLGEEGAPIRNIPSGHSLSFVALVRDDLTGIHLCTGSLISKKHVLTSASCLEGRSDVENLSAIFGTTTAKGFRSIFRISTRTTYLDWCRNSISCSWDKFTDDISILELNVGDIGLEPAAIDYQSDYLRHPGNDIRVVGWGQANRLLHPHIPRKAVLSILGKEDCEQRVRKLVPACFSDVQLPSKVSCAVANPMVFGVDGDFGGPVLVADHSNSRIILGILIQRCPVRNVNDFNSNQVNLILQLETFQNFIQDNIH